MLVGENGAGKIHPEEHHPGLVAPTLGSIRFAGVDRVLQRATMPSAWVSVPFTRS